jgi:hypothetical protein
MMTYIFIIMLSVCFLLFFIVSSPAPKVQGELLVSKGDAPASVVRRHASTFSSSLKPFGQIYFKFGL